MRFQTVIPLHFFHLGDASPFQLGPDVIIAPIPAWLKAESILKDLSGYDRHALLECTHCFLYEYEAEAMGSRDPKWTGDKPRSIQHTKAQAGFLANLALWLERPSLAGFTMLFHASEYGDGFLVRGWERHDQFLCHPDDAPNRLTKDALEGARKLYAALMAIPREARPGPRIEPSPPLQLNREIRYLLMWIALEALFGPDDAREMTFRISQRIALFLAADQTEARQLFRTAKSGYGFRSKVAHGHWKANPNADALIGSVETLIRRAMVHLLRDSESTQPFLGNKREEYLDDLVFLRMDLNQPLDDTGSD